MIEYRPMVGYEERYEVGSDGSIWSLNYRHTGKRKRMGVYDSGRGYMGFVSCVDFQKKRHQAHRVVAQAFLPNPNNLPQVNHKNGVRSDNRVENLEWMSVSDNHRHAYRELGRVHRTPKGEDSTSSKLTQEKVDDIRLMNMYGIPHEQIAVEYEVSRSQVWRIVKYKSWVPTWLQAELKNQV